MKALWRSIFLGLTALVIGLEVFAAVDGNDDTEPWTILIVTYVPVELAVLVFGGLVAWLPVHFWFAYRNRDRDD